MNNSISKMKPGMYICNINSNECYEILKVSRNDVGVVFTLADPEDMVHTMGRDYGDKDLVEISKERYEKAVEEAHKERIDKQSHELHTLSDSSIGDDFDGVVYVILMGKGEESKLPNKILCDSGWYSTKLIDDELVLFYQYREDAEKHVNRKTSLATSYIVGSVRIKNCKFDWTTLKLLTDTIKYSNKEEMLMGKTQESYTIVEAKEQDYSQYFDYIDDMYANNSDIDDQDVGDSLKNEFHLTDDQVGDILDQYIDQSYGKKQESYTIVEANDMEDDSEVDSDDLDLNTDETRN